MFAQLVGLFGTALFFASYQCRDNRQLFRVQFLSYLCYTAHLCSAQPPEPSAI